MLEDSEYYDSKDLKPPVKERMMFGKPDPQEQNVEKSRQTLASMPVTVSTQRDLMIDYTNPREELSKFAKGVDQIPAFDKGPLSLMKPYDDDARQQVSLVIKGRSNHILEEGKYDVTLENAKEKLQATLGGRRSGQRDPGPTDSERRELARASLMETTQSL
jgi:hypothetical protein